MYEDINKDMDQNDQDYYAEMVNKLASEQLETSEIKVKNKPSVNDLEDENIIKHSPEESEIEEYSFSDESIDENINDLIQSNEPIFPNGPLMSELEEWKQQYPESEQYKICFVQIDDMNFIFRTLNRFEYKQIINLKLSATGNEEAICNTVTLWPKDYTHKQIAIGRAGIPATYSNIIMQESGFVKEYEITRL